MARAHELGHVDPNQGVAVPTLNAAERHDPDRLARLGLDEQTYRLACALRESNVEECDRIVNAIRWSVPFYEVDYFTFAVGDGAERLIRNVPTLPAPGQWLFDGFVAWADPAAVANVAVTLQIEGVTGPVPLGFVASKTDVVSRGDLRLPVNPEARVKVTAAGTALDRAVVALRFKREGA